MNCQRFENVVSDIARGRMMEADVRDRALEHSDECEECAARLREEEQLTLGLRSLAGEMNHFEAPVALESKLFEAFRSRRVAPQIVVTQGYAGYRRYWVAAAAAVLLIVFGVMAMRWRMPSKQEVTLGTEQKPVEKVINPSPEPTLVVDKGTPKKAVKPRRQRHEFVAQNPRSQKRPAERPVANHAEVTTDFIPVGYLSAANLQEGGQIVRVEVPRSRLVSFGVPVNMERAHEKVKADVLVGVDGLARAIRFVQVVDND